MVKIIQSKGIKILLIVIFLCSSFFNISNASFLDDAIGSAQKFEKEGESQDNQLENEKDVTDFIYNALLSIGIAVAFIWGIVLGIQFTMGSVDEKADVKKNIITYLIGCVIIFGAFGIWKLVVEIMSNIAE